MAEDNQQRLESYLNFLIDRGIVDNEDDTTETIHKFLSQYETFEQESDASPNAFPEDDSQNADNFETRAIFTLADFMKGLSPNEYYDIASKIYSHWEENQHKEARGRPAVQTPREKALKLQRSLKKLINTRTNGAFNLLKQHSVFVKMYHKTQFLKETIHQLENQLSQVQSLQQQRSPENLAPKSLKIKRVPSQSSTPTIPVDENRDQHTLKSSINQGPSESKPPMMARKSSNGNHNRAPPSPIKPEQRLYYPSYQLSPETKQKLMKPVKRKSSGNRNQVRRSSSQNGLRPSPQKPGSLRGSRKGSTGSHQPPSESQGRGSNNQERSMKKQLSFDNVRMSNNGAIIPFTESQGADPFLYDRLAMPRDQLSMTQNVFKEQLNREMTLQKECSFTPSINPKSRELARGTSGSPRNKAQIDQLVSRLHRESEQQKLYKTTMRQLREAQEVGSCTFQPQTNTALVEGGNDSTGGMPPHIRLYQDAERHRNKKIFMQHHEMSLPEYNIPEDIKPDRTLTKKMDKKLLKRQNESSQARAERLYSEWTARQDRLSQKQGDAVLKELHEVKEQTKQYENPNSAKKRYRDVSPRLYDSGQDKSKRLNELKQKLAQEEGLTFEPQLKAQNYIEGGKFLERNKEFQQKRDEKVTKQKFEAENLAFTPALIPSKYSAKDLHKKDPSKSPKERRYDKLYAESKAREDKKQQRMFDLQSDERKQYSFQPKTNTNMSDKILQNRQKRLEQLERQSQELFQQMDL